VRCRESGESDSSGASSPSAVIERAALPSCLIRSPVCRGRSRLHAHSPGNRACETQTGWSSRTISAMRDTDGVKRKM
jgi:hypothetical protein